MNYWLIFFTGLTTGGLSCATVQGGLLAATLTGREHEPGPHASLSNFRHDLKPSLLFMASKLLSHTLLGALLGFFGAFVQLSSQVQGYFQILTGIYMLGLACHLLDLHPFFRHFVLTPPKWAGRLLRKESKNQHFFAPLVVGFLTFLIPCSITQGMMVLAVASGNPWAGALIMFSFILGTSPLFIAIGYLTTRLSESFTKKFYQVAASLIVMVALFTIFGGINLTGLTFASRSTPPSTEATTTPTIIVSNSGYSPTQITVPINQKITLNLVTSNSRSCANYFTIPSLKIAQALPQTGSTPITFTPTQTGPIRFTCGMGMYSGTINVVDARST